MIVVLPLLLATLSWALFTVMHRSIEGHWPAYLDRRPLRAPVLLAIDLLGQPNGWRQDPFDRDSMSHETGLRIAIWGGVLRVFSIDGVDIDLRQGEKRALVRAVKRGAEARKAGQSEAALLAWAASVQKYAGNVVSINRRSA